MLLAGCIGPIYDSLDEPSSSTWVDESEPPRPTTTGTVTWGVEQDMPAEPETTDDAAASLEIVAFEASHHTMHRAGTVVLTAEVEGDVTGMSLQIHQNGNPLASPGWPVGESSREFVINSDDLDGEVEFTLTAKAGPLSDTASLTIDVDLPESGTVDLRWVSPTISQGLALGVIPKSGTEPDNIVAVANDPEDVLLIGTMDFGELALKPRNKMKVHAIDVADGFVFVVGERDEDMVIRKYTADALQQYWENDYPNARAFDVAVGSNGDVFVAGEADVEGMIPHTEAALWTLTESGTFLHEPALFAAFDEWNWPYSSALHAVGFHDGRVVAAGYRDADIDQYPPRAALFEFLDGQLTDRDVYTGAFVDEECGWQALVTVDDGIVATGWHKTEESEPTSIAFGRYGADLVSEVFSPAWGGFGGGTAIAWQQHGYPVIAGHRTVDLEPRLSVQAESWPQPYIDDGGDKSWAHDVVIDRHGYVYVIGELIEFGEPHLILLRLHP